MTSPCPHPKVSPATVDCGVGAVHVAHRSGSPKGVLEERSVRTSCASLIAPSRLISPAPCSKVLNPCTCWAVYIRIAFTRFGVSEGLACRSNAAPPAAMGMAMDVPERYICALIGELLTLPSSNQLVLTK